jgi:hypothetical protein
MIIKLKGATFSNNINGLLNSWPITFYGRTLVTGTFTSSVSKGETYTATFNVADKCTVDSVDITRGGTVVGGATISGNTITISVPTTTESGPISITFNGSKENGDDPIVPDEPDEPITPTGYRFTINPTPSTATVTLTAEGYTQNGNSINVPSGTVVTYTTAADKYKTRSNETITITEDTTKEVALAALPYASGATMPSNGVVPENMFVKLPDTWLNGSGTALDQVLVGASGVTIGYNCCYLPINISGYTSIDLTAQTTAACYYQFFTTDGSWKLTDVRQKVDKGASKTVTIPSGAKYLVLADSRTNSTDANAVNGYLKYFPVSVKIY